MSYIGWNVKEKNALDCAIKHAIFLEFAAKVNGEHSYTYYIVAQICENETKK